MKMRKKTKNHLLLLLVSAVALLLGVALVANSLKDSLQTQDDPTDSTVSTTLNTQPSTQASEPIETTEPTTAPTTVPPTEPPTEPTTEETTEATTEAATVPEETTEAVIADPGERVAAFALEQVGKAYEYGKAGPDSFDSSGLLHYCFKEQGISIPRRISGQAGHGVEVSQDEILPGDVVFFWSDTPGEASYAAIYVGNGQCVACLNSSKNAYTFKLSGNYFQEHFVFARRYT